MKNFTLLALGIFIGAVGIIYEFGLSGKDNSLNNFNNDLVAGSAMPAASAIDTRGSLAPANSSNPVLSPKLTSNPVVSEIPKLTPIITPVSTPIPTPIPASTPTSIPTNSTPALTRSEVAKHTSQNDCYLIINNKVYNVSSFFGSHPGGNERILEYCGKEATGIFASIHSNYAWDLLSGYFAGNLTGG